MELGFSNEDLVFEFLQEAFGAVLLLHTSLDNYASEAMPETFEMPDDAGQLIGRKQIETIGACPSVLARSCRP
jgi:hypothetical protein